MFIRIRSSLKWTDIRTDGYQAENKKEKTLANNMEKGGLKITYLWKTKETNIGSEPIFEIL